VLGSSIIEELQHSAAQNGNMSVCYYFFRTDISSPLAALPTAAYRTMLSQILHQNRHNEDIIDRFVFQMIEGTGQLNASQSDMIEILLFCCQILGPVYMILDGIDECSDARALVQSVTKLSALSSVRILLLGRPSVRVLHQKTKAQQRVELSRSAVNDDITAFLTCKVNELVDEGQLPDVELHTLVEPLVSGADGMYVTPTLANSVLCCPVG
jgi:hypothetical protein